MGCASSHPDFQRVDQQSAQVLHREVHSVLHKDSLGQQYVAQYVAAHKQLHAKTPPADLHEKCKKAANKKCRGGGFEDLCRKIENGEVVFCQIKPKATWAAKQAYPHTPTQELAGGIDKYVLERIRCMVNQGLVGCVSRSPLSRGERPPHLQHPEARARTPSLTTPTSAAAPKEAPVLEPVAEWEPVTENVDTYVEEPATDYDAAPAVDSGASWQNETAATEPALPTVASIVQPFRNKVPTYNAPWMQDTPDAAAEAQQAQLAAAAAPPQTSPQTLPFGATSTSPYANSSGGLLSAAFSAPSSSYAAPPPTTGRCGLANTLANMYSNGTAAPPAINTSSGGGGAPAVPGFGAPATANPGFGNTSSYSQGSAGGAYAPTAAPAYTPPAAANAQWPTFTPVGA